LSPIIVNDGATTASVFFVASEYAIGFKTFPAPDLLYRSSHTRNTAVSCGLAFGDDMRLISKPTSPRMLRKHFDLLNHLISAASDRISPGPMKSRTAGAPSDPVA